MSTTQEKKLEDLCAIISADIDRLKAMILASDAPEPTMSHLAKCGVCDWRQETGSAEESDRVLARHMEEEHGEIGIPHVRCKSCGVGYQRGGNDCKESKPKQCRDCVLWHRLTADNALSEPNGRCQLLDRIVPGGSLGCKYIKEEEPKPKKYRPEMKEENHEQNQHQCSLWEAIRKACDNCQR